MQTENAPNDAKAPTNTDGHLYTTVSGNNNSIPLDSSNISASSPDSFTGWKVEGDNVTIPPTVTSLVLDGHSASSTTQISSDGLTATLGKTVVEKVYKDGVLNLEAQWRNPTQPISVTDGYGNRIVKHYGDTRTFTTSFNSDKAANASSTTRYAIYRYDGSSKNSNLGICEAGTISSDGRVERIKGNRYYGNILDVTAEVRDANIILTITHGAPTNKVFKVYVWNEANSSLNLGV